MEIARDFDHCIMANYRSRRWTFESVCQVIDGLGESYRIDYLYFALISLKMVDIDERVPVHRILK